MGNVEKIFRLYGDLHQLLNEQYGNEPCFEISNALSRLIESGAWIDTKRRMDEMGPPEVKIKEPEVNIHGIT